MKKILATILAVAMLATTFVGCGNGGETASTPSDDGGAAAPQNPAFVRFRGGCSRNHGLYRPGAGDFGPGPEQVRGRRLLCGPCV